MPFLAPGPLGPGDLLAHEAWFVDDFERFPLRWDLLTSVPTAVAVGTAAAAAVTVVVVDRVMGEPRLRWLDPLVALRPAVPRILAAAIGVALAGTAMIDGYLAPSMLLPDDALGRALALLEVAIAVLLIANWNRRVAAGLLVLAGPVGMLAYGVRPVLERADLLGAAAFLVLAYGGEAPATARALVNPLATRVMRVLAAVAIGVLAFTEKLVNPDLARAFLDRYPDFDLLALVGVDDPGQVVFITFAATAELTLAVLLLLNRLPRLTVVLVGTPFLVTWPLLGVREFVGHLPLYAILLVVLIEAQVRRLPEHHDEALPVTPPRPGGDAHPGEALAHRAAGHLDRLTPAGAAGGLLAAEPRPGARRAPPTATPDPPAPAHHAQSPTTTRLLGAAAVALALQRTRVRPRREAATAGTPARRARADAGAARRP